MGNKATCVKQYLRVKCAADLFFSQHTESHAVESSGCVWIVYKVALKETHEGLVELLQYYTSAHIDIIVSY
ncbi:uncharacterized protein Gasu_62720 [Galdieria sulphuraria]|uniref:Uncharacterized protein n=1 Tax=Galdieria sulphuraria TaxID=130081 RepID=M2X8A4_GALSU|nr:uncharacterized protein Gasu_62720 [Galdieria sulphuraria]EME26077.1 hypothetical protein Gasu_62720 [Galdieria sulphuraria]|eukprot:XP_005702597.1 hypothetical protein Gasu_62720 [Galdieria sulphuraria]